MAINIDIGTATPQNIELNYFDGTNYQILYPKAIFSNMAGSLTESQIPNLSADKITSGTLGTDRIPTLNASKITTGTFGGSKGTEYVFPGNVRIGGTGSSSAAYFRIGDSDYIHLYEYEDDKLEIKGSTINLVTSNLLLNGSTLSGGANVSMESQAYTGTGNTTDSITLTPGKGGKPRALWIQDDLNAISTFSLWPTETIMKLALSSNTNGTISQTVSRLTWNDTNVVFRPQSSTTFNRYGTVYRWLMLCRIE